MNNTAIIKVNNQINRFIRKCIEHNINLLDISYITNDEILVKIYLNDYKKIKRLNYYSDIVIIRYEGYNAVKKHIKRNVYIYLIIFLSFVLVEICTNFIIRIDIVHENSVIRKLVKDELDDLGVSRFKLAKNFDELEKIKNIVLNNNQTALEWLSITRIGMTYEIRIEERIITNIKPEEGQGHIVAFKDGLITKVIGTKGDVLVRSGDYVKKGDILISGQIKLYESIKGNILAKGEVYGEVWYESDIKIPLFVDQKEYTKKKRFNIKINDKTLFRDKYQLYDKTKVKELKLFNFYISIYNEEEYILKTINYTSKEAEDLALKKIKAEFNTKLNGKGQVLSQKVLKKEQNNSTMNIRVFVVTNELISKPQYYDIGSEEL